MGNTLMYVMERETLETKLFLMKKETEAIFREQITFHNVAMFLLHEAHLQGK